MPSVGTEFGGIFPDMNEEEHLLLQAGIPIFQMKYPEPTEWDKTIMGFFGAIADAPDPDARKIPIQVKWLTRGDAKIIFKASKSRQRVAIAWAPDDMWWHNRMIFMDQPSWLKCVLQERLPDGRIKDAMEVAFEIHCMTEVLKAKTPYFKVMQERNGILHEVSSFVKEQDAKDFIEAQGKMELKEKDGVIKPVKIFKKNFSIDKGERLDYRPEINLLRETEKRKHRFGWTECEEFQRKIKPEIQERINEGAPEIVKATQKLDAESILEAINNMGPQAMAALRAKLLGKAGNKHEKEEVAA